MHDDKGRYTNAMYSMMRTILKIMTEQKPTHMMFAFDQTRDTFRREKYPDYKGNRGDTPEPLKEQFENMEKTIRKQGKQAELNGDEDGKKVADEKIQSIHEEIARRCLDIYFDRESVK